MIEKPLISVIVPVFKVEPYLRRCVDSILSQTYSKLEIILVDDGSPDQCPAICDEYALRDSRVLVIHKKNGGLSSARNAGLDCCKGEFVSFVDSDDYISLDFIEYLYEGIESCNADIALTSFTRFTKKQNPDQLTENKPFCIKSLEYLFERCSSMNTFVSMETNVSWNKLYKAKLFKNIRFPNGRIFEDVATTHKVLLKSKTVAVSSSPKYFYYVRSDSIIGEKKFSEQYLDFLWALDEAEKWLINQGAEKYARYYIPPKLMPGIYSWWGEKYVVNNQKMSALLLTQFKKNVKRSKVSPYYSWKWKCAFTIIAHFPILYTLYRRFFSGLIGKR